MAPMDNVSVESSPEAQNDAYEVICHILEQAGIKEQVHEKEPEVMKTRIGPRRVEVKLVQRGDPKHAVEVMILEYHPPSGPFKYHTLKARTWNATSKRLESVVQTFHSNCWWISNVTKHLSPGKSTSSFHGEQDSQGWGRVEEFLKTMQPSEINVLRHLKWQQKADNDEDDDIDGRWSCGRHHMGGTPDHYRNPYKPSAVFFRVSGDEIGKKAFLIQAEKRVKDCPNPPTLEEFLEEAEKKAVAGDASDSEEISSAASDLPDDVSRGSEDSSDVGDSDGGSPSTTGADDSNLPTPDPELDFLEDDIGGAFGAVPYIPGMDGAPFSAIESTLHHYPRALGLDLLDLLTGKRKKRTLH